jgi:2-polyprenyl-6-methoxyphenol hydroxylase-like FAD-dependent oxidoreductase
MHVNYKRIVVLGGGTSGWMAALALATGLPHSSVTVVESEDVGIVGVGEATFPSIRAFHDIVGVNEAEFLRATNGTFKLGIKFVDWLEHGNEYFHTFGSLGETDGAGALWGHYLRAHDAAGRASMSTSTPNSTDMLGTLGEQCLPAVMGMQNRFCMPDAKSGADFAYAYHFDATLYGPFLRDQAAKHGVRRIEGKVVEVARRPDGAVASLRLADGRDVAGDLFIDCSGFSSLLLGKTLGEPFVDYSHWLPVDRAWACPAERGDAPLTPYTRATALEAGWAWRIPLRNRTGFGHVFSSRHIDEERARAQLLAHMDGAPLAEPRLLRFTTGRRARFWVDNVVALGLASGFLEPLESTSIYLVQIGIGRLMLALQSDKPVDDDVKSSYNMGLVRHYERCRDVIILHYCLSRRRDSQFWRDMADMTLPETLAFKMHVWRQSGLLYQYDEEAFTPTSWLAIYAGMEQWPQRCDPRHAQVPGDASARWLEDRRAQVAQLVGTLPSHERFLDLVLAQR